ncbi:transmembrane protein 26 [Patella vulgata]|uniref:transmembrane protein 26 n=1 Tax=Patella vulgata TaxID=6465 RepID=UPI00217F9BBF|nr:transmembrane protein 26 [Patella vulgata]XP_050412257.1 transmembrane protein 26 [Patella vulgata]
MSLLSIARAITVRLLFVCHGMLTIWRVCLVTKDDKYWYLGCVLGLLVVELAITLGLKGGKEWKWFCPSVFIYLMCIVPAIWFLELYEMEKRLSYREESTNTSLVAYNETMEEMSATLGSVLGVKFEIRIPILLSSDEWIRTLEQVLLLILIIGRWLLPKGKLTHDQLSQLLLVYIGTAADIVEFFEAFKEEKVRNNQLLCMIILGIWSLSLIRFSLVLTASRSRQDYTGLVPMTPEVEKGCCSADVYGIIISILLQDAPFLVLRMLLIFKYNVLSYTNMFFTSKNTIVITLLVYRLVVVQIEKRAEQDVDYNKYRFPYDPRSKRYLDSISLSSSKSSIGSKNKLVVNNSNHNAPHSNGFYDTSRQMRLKLDQDRVGTTYTLQDLNSPV